MRYLIGVIFPGLLQVLVVFIIVETNQGNGSWAGLGAYLIGLFAIPLTALINGLYVWKNPNVSLLQVIGKSFTLAMIVPILCVFTLFL
jgi:hypothetical protein